jgi:hypothetical protein
MRMPGSRTMGLFLAAVASRVAVSQVEVGLATGQPGLKMR